MATADQAIHLREFDADRSLLDRQAPRYLEMSGKEFARAWEAGEFGDRDEAALVRVAMLLPFGR